MRLSPLSFYGLVLLSAVAHAAWNALVKSAGDRLLMMAAIRLVGLTYGLVMLPFVPWPSPGTWMWLAFATAAVFAYYGFVDPVVPGRRNESGLSNCSRRRPGSIGA